MNGVFTLALTTFIIFLPVRHSLFNGLFLSSCPSLSLVRFSKAFRVSLPKSARKRSIRYIAFIPLLLVALFSLSCRDVTSKANNIIDSAGNKKIELAKVIQHYRNDSDEKKLKAAVYLIENLPLQTHTTGQGVMEYQSLFRKLLKVPEERKDDYDAIYDSLQKASFTNFPGTIEDLGDIKSISAQYLINHIDAAFKAWTQPWAKQLSFDEFCKYILPYKLVNEVPEIWMPTVQHRYAWLQDSMKGSQDSYRACILVNRQLKRTFTIRSFPTIWDVGFNDLDAIQSGKCFHATQYTAYVMRSLGIPVVMDFTQFWGNMNGGHDWDALIYNGRTIPFVGSESDPGLTKIDLAFQRKRAKVFRHTFAPEPNSLPMQVDEDEPMPSNLNNSRMADVTDAYIPVTDVSLIINGKVPEAKAAYLCVFNQQMWTPVFWGKIEEGNHVTFQKMGRNIVYAPMYYDDGKLIAAGEPFYINHNGEISTIGKPSAESGTITISKKSPQGPSIEKDKTYQLFYWGNGWIKAGEQKATDKKISFAHVPANKIYWVHSPDKSTKERIFTYEKNNATWW